MNQDHSIPKLKVEIPTTDYWKKQIKCQYACPVHTDARGYVRAIADGDFEQAYLIARAPNPLASICGRVCGAPCEAACRRGDIDEPISIRALKRSAHEESNAADIAALEVIKRIKESFQQRECADIDDVGFLTEALEGRKFKKAQGKSVGIIGSGPAGLAAAHDLALLGISVLIYEMEPVPAGMLYLGVPAYRLPRELIEAEIDVIKALGVRIRTNCTVGVDISFDEIKKSHDAVVIAVGCKKSRSLPIPGADAKGVMGGVEFLRDVALDLPHEVGRKIVVIGGGNVAYDIARSALRRQQMDVVRTLYLARKNIKVTLCCIENRDEMLADEIEILEGEEEGIDRLNGYGPQEILIKDGKVSGVLFHKIISIFDDQKRFNPQYDHDDAITLDADMVMMAIGQRSDISFIDKDRDGIHFNQRGVIDCDEQTLETSASNVYLAGDLAYGPKLMIDAIASGKKVARSIYQKLTGQSLDFVTSEHHNVLNDYNREKGYEKIRRQVLKTVKPQDRITSHDIIVEKGFSCGSAKVEGSRCLDCGVNTIFDGNKCILCGGCVDVCPELCLKLVDIKDLEGDQNFDTLTDIVKDQKQTHDLTAIIKDEDLCIRCSLCAIRCPTDAITMERFSFKTKLIE